MLAVSLYLGNRLYPIPYRWSKITGYLVAGLLLYFASIVIPQENTIFKYSLRTLFILIYIFVYIKQEKISIWKLKL